MTDSAKHVRDVGRRQLDRRVDRIRSVLPSIRRPPRGWVATLRKSLGMSQADLGRRMGVTRQAIGQLERRESDGSVTIRALKEAARALGGELVYAIVPERSIQRTLAERADRIARRLTSSLRHTMRLEDQEPEADLEEQTRAVAAELLASPRRLWSLPDGE